MQGGAVETAITMPKNSVTILRGKVLDIHHPVLWGMDEVAGIKIVRSVDGSFSRILFDPELGGLSMKGTLDEVLKTLHPGVADTYRQVFAMESPTKESLHAILPDFQVIVLS